MKIIDNLKYLFISLPYNLAEIILDNIYLFLFKKQIYNPYINKKLPHFIYKKKKDISSNTIWQFWDGNEMPKIVKNCVDSVKQKKPANWNHIILNNNNITDYIDMPDVIINLLKNKKIKYCHYADYIRLALLATYGGIWMDATIFLTDNIPSEILQSHFFVFENFETNINHKKWINYCPPAFGFNSLFKFKAYNYFIKSDINNELIKEYADLFYYHLIKNKSICYFGAMIILTLLLKEKGDKNRYRLSVFKPETMQFHFYDKYSDKLWNEIISNSFCHKLTHKKKANNNDEILDHIINLKI